MTRKRFSRHRGKRETAKLFLTNLKPSQSKVTLTLKVKSRVEITPEIAKQHGDKHRTAKLFPTNLDSI